VRRERPRVHFKRHPFRFLQLFSAYNADRSAHAQLAPSVAAADPPTPISLAGKEESMACVNRLPIPVLPNLARPTRPYTSERFVARRSIVPARPKCSVRSQRQKFKRARRHGNPIGIFINRRRHQKILLHGQRVGSPYPKGAIILNAIAITERCRNPYPGAPGFNCHQSCRVHLFACHLSLWNHAFLWSVHKEGVKAAFWWDFINASRLHPTDATPVASVMFRTSPCPSVLQSAFPLNDTSGGGWLSCRR
jgi:hypothetical protein